MASEAEMQTIKERLKGLHNPSRCKLTLFACSCVREVWHLLKDESKNAVIAAEKYADGLISKEEMQKAVSAAYAAYHTATAYDADAAYAAAIAAIAADAVYAWAAYYACAACADAASNQQKALTKQHQLFDDIFGS